MPNPSLFFLLVRKSHSGRQLLHRKWWVSVMYVGGRSNEDNLQHYSNTWDRCNEDHQSPLFFSPYLPLPNPPSVQPHAISGKAPVGPLPQCLLLHGNSEINNTESVFLGNFQTSSGHDKSRTEFARCHAARIDVGGRGGEWREGYLVFMSRISGLRQLWDLGWETQPLCTSGKWGY